MSAMEDDDRPIEAVEEGAAVVAAEEEEENDIVMSSSQDNDVTADAANEQAVQEEDDADDVVMISKPATASSSLLSKKKNDKKTTTTTTTTPKKKRKAKAKKEKTSNGDDNEDESAAAADKPPAKKKRKKTSNVKRALSAYQAFSKQMYCEVKAANPTLSFGEMQKLVSAKWKEITPEAKVPFEELAKEDKVRYAREIKAEQEQKERDGELNNDDDGDDKDDEKKPPKKKKTKTAPKTPAVKQAKNDDDDDDDEKVEEAAGKGEESLTKKTPAKTPSPKKEKKLWVPHDMWKPVLEIVQSDLAALVAEAVPKLTILPSELPQYAVLKSEYHGDEARFNGPLLVETYHPLVGMLVQERTEVDIDGLVAYACNELKEDLTARAEAFKNTIQLTAERYDYGEGCGDGVWEMIAINMLPQHVRTEIQRLRTVRRAKQRYVSSLKKLTNILTTESYSDADVTEKRAKDTYASIGQYKKKYEDSVVRLEQSQAKTIEAQERDEKKAAKEREQQEKQAAKEKADREKAKKKKRQARVLENFFQVKKSKPNTTTTTTTVETGVVDHASSSLTNSGNSSATAGSLSSSSIKKPIDLTQPLFRDWEPPAYAKIARMTVDGYKTSAEADKFASQIGTLNNSNGDDDDDDDDEGADDGAWKQVLADYRARWLSLRRPPGPMHVYRMTKEQRDLEQVHEDLWEEGCDWPNPLNKVRKFFLFHDNIRPAFHGIHPLCDQPLLTSGKYRRRPFARVSDLDYEYASDDDWEEDKDAIALDSDDKLGGDDDDADINDGERADGLEEDGWLVAEDDQECEKQVTRLVGADPNEPSKLTLINKVYKRGDPALQAFNARRLATEKNDRGVLNMWYPAGPNTFITRFVESLNKVVVAEPEPVIAETTTNTTTAAAAAAAKPEKTVEQQESTLSTSNMLLLSTPVTHTLTVRRKEKVSSPKPMVEPTPGNKMAPSVLRLETTPENGSKVIKMTSNDDTITINNHESSTTATSSGMIIVKHMDVERTTSGVKGRVKQLFTSTVAQPTEESS